MQNFRLVAAHKFIARNTGGVCQEREMPLRQWLGTRRRLAKSTRLQTEWQSAREILFRVGPSDFLG